MYDVSQTYEPTTSSLGVHVPTHPEGFQYADYFDTYAGKLTNPINFTAARPIACGFPADLPGAGDFLTVADPLPNPQPGNGYYYVTAVTHQGQRRYGRKRIGEVLSGRDPALLPACSE